MPPSPVQLARDAPMARELFPLTNDDRKSQEGAGFDSNPRSPRDGRRSDAAGRRLGRGVTDAEALAG